DGIRDRNVTGVQTCALPICPVDHVPDVIDGASLEIRPGETMALVGVTGSGKSTLLQLVPRLYDVTSGAITIDGIDVRDMDLTDRSEERRVGRGGRARRRR